MIELVFALSDTLFLEKQKYHKVCKRMEKKISSMIPKIYYKLDFRKKETYNVRNMALATEALKLLANDRGYYFAFKKRHTYIFLKPTSLDRTMYEGDEIPYFSKYLVGSFHEGKLCLYEITLE